MKAYKIIGTILWIISAFLAGLGLITYYCGIPPENSQVNIPLIKFSVLLFGMTFVMMTPIYLNLLFRDSFWKNQKEIDDLREKYHDSINSYNEAKNKLTKAILDYKPEDSTK